MATQPAPPEEEKIPIYEKFNLKTDDDTSSKNTTGDGGKKKEKQGRLYSAACSEKPGGVRVEEMIYGIQMAHMSCTDDSEGRLEGAGANTVEALKLIVGEDNVRKPLTDLLKERFNLTLDCWIDESGLRVGRAVDTQGFIASNDDTIVLSYRFSTSLLDWVTNLSMTTSEWEPDVDALLGHAGVCSCMDGWMRGFTKGERKPRVHTGFYNNFVYTIPMIRKHILEKILRQDATPKKVYVVGCSLGAALATMAFSYVILEASPLLMNMDHKIISVTAGCPRVCDSKMKKVVMEQVDKLGAKDKAVCCRLVYNHDVVPHIPFNIGGFEHLDKLIYITPDGDVIVNPKLQGTKRFSEVKSVCSNFWNDKKKKASSQGGANETSNIGTAEKSAAAIGSTEEKFDDEHSKNESAAAPSANNTDAEAVDEDEQTPFEKEVATTPGPIKDHMPYWYLTFLEKLKERVADPQ